MSSPSHRHMSSFRRGVQPNGRLLAGKVVLQGIQIHPADLLNHCGLPSASMKYWPVNMHHGPRSVLPHWEMSYPRFEADSSSENATALGLFTIATNSSSRQLWRNRFRWELPSSYSYDLDAYLLHIVQS